MTNRKLLEQTIQNSGIKMSHIADQLGISRAGLNNKISGKSEFKVSELLQMQRLLNLDDATTRDIFLQSDVNKIHTATCGEVKA